MDLPSSVGVKATVAYSTWEVESVGSNVASTDGTVSSSELMVTRDWNKPFEDAQSMYEISRTTKYSTISPLTPVSNSLSKLDEKVKATKDTNEQDIVLNGNGFEHPETFVATTTPVVPHSFPLNSIRVVCLGVNVNYFDKAGSSPGEEEAEDWKENEIGVFCVFSALDTLAKVRAELYRQIDPDRMPLKFHFLKPHDASSSPRSVFWVETVPWHKENSILLSDCLTDKGATLMLSSPISLIKPSEIVYASSSIEEARALWEKERRALIMEIQNLEARLAQALHQEEFVPNSSLLKRALIALKKEGFVTRDVDELETEYLKLFSRHDVETVFTPNESNPFRFVWRRLAEEPSKMREYLESLQSILVRFRIRKTRLISKFWTRVLRDMRFVTNPQLYKQWALAQPWTQDEAERSAYLGSLVLSDMVGLDEYMILHDPVPGNEVVTQGLDGINDGTADDGKMQQQQQSVHRSIAQAAEEFHKKAVLKHTPSPIMDTPEAKDTLSEATVKLPKTTQRSAIPLDHPCDFFQVDVLAAQFGICICGYSRWDHTALQKQKKTLSVRMNSAVAEAINVQQSLIPCKSYQVDLSATRYGVCVCGFAKEDHVDDDGKSTLDYVEIRRNLRPMTAAIVMDGQQPQPNGQNVSRIDRIPITRETWGKTGKPCSAFIVDVDASRYGVCLCGFDKKDHHVNYLDDDMQDSAFSGALHGNEETSRQNENDPRRTSKDRARYAVRWVEGEISRLITRIQIIGKLNAAGDYEITFGELFRRYQNISDTLLGILIRAKRRKIIKYEGSMGDLLLQGRHDNVVITLLTDQVDPWRRSREIQTVGQQQQ